MSRHWTPVDAKSFTSILDSGCTFELSRDRWPFGIDQSHIERMFIYGCAPGEQVPSMATSSEMVARLLTERFDGKDSLPMNYNWYAVVRGTNGSYFQSAPRKDVDFGHHLAARVSLSALGIITGE